MAHHVGADCISFAPFFFEKSEHLCRMAGKNPPEADTGSAPVTLNRRKAKQVVKSKQSIRYIQGAEIAILFIHGILGTPDYFKPFLPFVPPGWSTCNILLKGHGGGVKDFSSASMAEWKQQVHEAENILEDSSGEDQTR